MLLCPRSLEGENVLVETLWFHNVSEEEKKRKGGGGGGREEKGLFKLEAADSDAVNEEDPERDRATPA